MILRASSITDVGMARGDLSEAGVPLAFLVSPLPFVVAADDDDGLPFALDVDEGWPSRTSSRTRRRRAGYVVISPERRRARAWFWMVVGQLEEFELRAWRRASWIFVICPSLSRIVFICDRKSGSSVAGV